MRSYNSDHRTPLAWRHRDTTLHASPTRGNQIPNHHNHHHHHNHRRPPTPSETTTTSGDEREEVPIVRHGTPYHHHNHHHNHHNHNHHNHQRRPGSRSRNSSAQQHFRDEQSQFSGAEGGPYRNGGTLRSTRSVPALALATWDGEPCPVHGHGVPFYHQPPMPYAPGSLRRGGSLFDMRGPFFAHGGLMPPPHPALLMGPPPPPPPLMDKKSFHGSMQMLAASNGPFPPHFLPPMMRPRPFVFPAGVEPLPVRDPFKKRTPPPSGYASSNIEDPYSVDQVCCKGHLIVLWIILAVVTIGVILGIVLGVTIA